MPFQSDAPDVMNGHKSRVFSACFNPKSAYEIISGGWDDTVQFWDTRQPYALRHITGVHICGDGLDISRDGKEVSIKNNRILVSDYTTEVDLAFSKTFTQFTSDIHIIVNKKVNSIFESIIIL